MYCQQFLTVGTKATYHHDAQLSTILLHLSLLFLPCHAAFGQAFSQWFGFGDEDRSSWIDEGNWVDDQIPTSTEFGAFSGEAGASIFPDEILLTATTSVGGLLVAEAALNINGGGLDEAMNVAGVPLVPNILVGTQFSDGESKLTVSNGGFLLKDVLINSEGDGTARAIVGNNAIVTMETTLIAAGITAMSHGNLTIDGGIANSDLLVVGSTGTGSLDILNGSFFGPTSAASPVVVGQGGGTGTVTVSGTNSLFSANVLALGQVSPAVLNVTDGGTATFNNMQAAILPTSNATLNVSGVGSKFVLSPAEEGAFSIAILNANTEIVVADGGAVNLGVGEGGAGQVNILPDGALFSDGRIDGNVALSGGFLSPGAEFSPGSLQVDGDLNLATGRLTLELGGSEAAMNDQLTVSGAAKLGASLIDVNLSDGFEPTVGQEFTVLTAASITNDGISLINEDKSAFELVIDGTTLKIRIGGSVDLANDCNQDGKVDQLDLLCVCGGELTSLQAELGILPGDLDGNGDVNFADFLVLSGNFGDTDSVGYAGGDIDCDGSVAFSDFLVLSGNFGKTSQTIASVPEPNQHIVLILIGIACLYRIKRG